MKLKINDKYIVNSKLEGKTSAILIEKKTVYIFRSSSGQAMIIPEKDVEEKVTKIEE